MWNAGLDKLQAEIKIAGRNISNLRCVDGTTYHPGWKQWQISSSWALKSLQMVTAAIKLEDNCFLTGKLWQT